MNKLKIVKVPISEIKKYKHNAKLHPQWQIDKIKASIKEFGFNDPIAIDENNVIIEGHGRFEALKQMDKKYVPCIVLDHLSKAQKKAYIIAHNKLNMDTGFDKEILLKEMQEIQSENIDFERFDFLDFDIDEEKIKEISKEKNREFTYFTEKEIIQDVIKGWKTYDSVEEYVANIIDIPTAKYQFNRLCQGFNDGYNISLLFNPHRLETDTHKNKSIMYAINNSDVYKREFARYMVNLSSKVVTANNYYKYIGIGSGGFQYVNEFQPYLARDIYKKFCKDGDKILDPCAGWGGRMIGFAASMLNNTKYYATDPSTKTYNGLLRLREFLRLDSEDVKLKNLPFEKLKLKENSFDFCFTSPPYFDTEHYSDEKTQSMNSNKNYDDWKENFLYVMLDKIMYALKPNCFCLLNVGKTRYDIDKDIILYMKNKYSVKVKYIKDFKIGGSGIGTRTGEDGEPFLMFKKKK